MQLRTLKLSQFKNYTASSFEFHPRLNLILGNNGVGKTNLLDAIYYLAFCKSYYSITDSNLVQIHGKSQRDPFFRIWGSSPGSGQYTMTYSPSRGKSITRNDVEYDRISDHIGEIPLVSIFPEDIYLIRHGSALRRKFVDGTIGQLDRVYLDALIQYNRIIRQKNEVLKNRRFSGNDRSILLDKYDQELVPHIGLIETMRYAFVKEFDPLFSSYYQKIVQSEYESSTVAYARSFKSNDIGTELRTCRQVDIEKGISTKGPHKDDFRILLNGQRASQFASQGQQKSILFSLKLAQFAYIQRTLKRNPLLLLDDFFEKLDYRRINHVMSILVAEHPGQIFITDTDAERMIKMAEKAGLEYKTIHIE